ncbi:MAG TPA: diaminopimelate epimerase [Stellaceae bacterium]|nr:diaminopimelate epimerase [Stellaceae bacterium]
MRAIDFVKMHGLGNDFVILDARAHELALNDSAARALADRHRGVGCDQILIVEKPQREGADAFMRIRNADGGEAEACGNGARCVAALLIAEAARERVVIDTLSGPVEAWLAGDRRIAVDMGEPRFGWRGIPLARDCDTLHVPLSLGPLADPVCTGMGNPHATFFVADVERTDLATLGPKLEHDPIFPARANIGVAQILSPRKIRLRVWERGDGLTLACGSGACAALVGAARRGLAERRAEIVADGGSLEIEWRGDNHVVMTGPVATSFRGVIDPALLS